MVVYPGHGVGKIEKILKKLVLGSEHSFLEISVSANGMKILIPESQADSKGLRKVVDKREITKVYTILKDRDTKSGARETWNRRSRKYDEKIKTGSVVQIAEVLRDLAVLKHEKELSTGEKDMLSTAKNLLVSEIAIAKGRPADKILSEIEELVAC